ncbi:MAG: dienelactone hydrolase family protein [Sporichthyaceae bacterium]
MAQIALFHSVLGIRPGILDAAGRFTADGHEVLVVDQYDGKAFDDYREAMIFAEHLGFTELFHRGARAVAPLADGFIVAGFSNGGAMAELIALQRPVSGVVLFGGALDPAMLNPAVGNPDAATTWPPGVPAQVHTTVEDPWREQDQIDAFAAAVQAAGGQIQIHDYPGTGHLFTDASLAEEYDEAASELAWRRVLAFCRNEAVSG